MMECFNFWRNPHYASFLSSFFTTPRECINFLMVSRLIAVYSVCLEILPFRKKLVAPAQEPRKRKLLRQKESQQAQIGSVCFYAPMGMLPFGRDLIFHAEEAYYF